MQTVILDLSRKNIIPPVHAKQGDVGRKFKAVLTDAGVTYAIPRGAQFSVWYSGASGEGNYSAIGDTSAFTVEENVVTVELITQMVTNSGTGTMCLILSGADGSQIGLWNITYVVEAVPGIGSEAAENYYTALSEVAEKAVRAAETFQTDPTLKISGRAADAEATGVALAGKAPAGYGLGEMRGKTTTDFNTCILCGLYNGSNAVNGPSFVNNAPYSAVFVVRGTTKIYQTMYFVGGTAQRHSDDGGSTWEPWEAVNPPMVPGVEYRTTERHNGKAVYTKLIDFGALPNATMKSVAVVSGATVGYYPVSCDAIITKGFSKYPLPYITKDGEMATISFGGSVVTIETATDMSNCTAMVRIKYTKD